MFIDKYLLTYGKVVFPSSSVQKHIKTSRPVHTA